MNQDTHPPLEQLIAFSEDPTSPQHAGMGRHLADCVDCRQRLAQLDIISQSLRVNPPTGETDAHTTALSDELLQAIDDNQLHDSQRRLLDDDPAALKAALHYAIHAPAMQRHLARPAGTTLPAGTGAQAKNPGLLQRLLGWRPPAWAALPLTATAAFALALVVIPPQLSPDSAQHQPGLIVASYSDRQALVLQDPAADLPGMGFFHGAEGREIPFDGLQLSYSRTDGLSANWVPVDNAKNYQLRLSRIATQGQQRIAETRVNQPPARFAQLRPRPGRYRWQLTGQLHSGERFRASGGFVVNERPNNE